MSEEDIKEYVDNALNEWCTNNHQIVEPWHCVVEDLSLIAVVAIKKIAKDYCIVPKEKVIELQVDALKRCTSQEFYDGAIYALEEIFCKSIFEQKGE